MEQLHPWSRSEYFKVIHNGLQIEENYPSLDDVKKTWNINAIDVHVRKVTHIEELLEVKQ